MLFYSFLFIIASEWSQIKGIRKEHYAIKRVIAIILIPVSVFILSTVNTFKNDEVVFVSVGQGDCTHIKCGNNDILIDGGGQSNYDVGKKILMSYLLKNGANNLDLALVTHLHQDHFKGILELNNCYPVGVICVPSFYYNLNNEARFFSNSDTSIKSISTLDEIVISNRISIKPIWPIGKINGIADNDNELNMVYKVEYEGINILITGDIMADDEKKMVDYYKGTNMLDCEVLKISHHGSKSSTSKELLDAVNPKIAIISVGRNNMYGHPHQETLDKLNARGIKTFRTDLNGAVGVDITRSGIRMDTMR